MPPELWILFNEPDANTPTTNFSNDKKTDRITEAQRYHCKYNSTTASFISLPLDLFYCRDFYFTAASFILAPLVLFYCREFYYTAAGFILLPQFLL